MPAVAAWCCRCVRRRPCCTGHTPATAHSIRIRQRERGVPVRARDRVSWPCGRIPSNTVSATWPAGPWPPGSRARRTATQPTAGQLSSVVERQGLLDPRHPIGDPRLVAVRALIARVLSTALGTPALDRPMLIPRPRAVIRLASVCNHRVALYPRVARVFGSLGLESQSPALPLDLGHQRALAIARGPLHDGIGHLAQLAGDDLPG